VESRAEPKALKTAADISAAVVALRNQCPTMRRLHDLVGDPPLRRQRAGFEGLAGIVVAQQLSAASANAIWRRTAEVVRPFRPEVLAALSDEALRGAGLSRPKIRTLRALSEAATSGALDFRRLHRASEAQLREALTAVSGIGPWTADIYVMFCLRRPDAFAPGDLALQLSAQSAFSLKSRPGPDEIEALAERWRPWRSVAALILWSYYAHERRR
jgi:DNA-3-methyladenine glycosylase II